MEFFKWPVDVELISWGLTSLKVFKAMTDS